MNLEGVVRRKFNERWTAMKEKCVNGEAVDYPEYRYMCGYLKGMYDFYGDIEKYIKDPDSAGDGEDTGR